MIESAAETILLVEDEDAVRAVVSAILRRRGYEVLEAPRPSVACEIFDRRGPEIDLLLTDIVMPEMNGGALAARLIARRPELRVLFISGYTDSTTQPSPGNPPAVTRTRAPRAHTAHRRRAVEARHAAQFRRCNRRQCWQDLGYRT